MGNIHGVYSITNILTNGKYIGGTKNVKGFPRRRTEHFSKLRNNKHYNRYLQEDFNNQCESDFIFEIIECCSKDQVVIKEQLYLNKYGINNLYNIAPRSDCPATATRPNSRIPVIQLDLNGNFLNRYDSVAIASKGSNCNRSKISSCICNKRFTTGGFIWIKESEYNAQTVILKLETIEKNKEDNRNKPTNFQKGTNLNGQIFNLYDKNTGTFIKSYPSATSASKEFNCSYNTIINLSRNITKSSKIFTDYIWVEANNSKLMTYIE